MNASLVSPEQLKAIIKSARMRARASTVATDTPVKRAARERAATVVKKASEATSEKVITSLAALKLNVSAALDHVGSQLTGEITTLKEVQEAIAAERAKLEDLYAITAEADSLQTLVLAQDEQRLAFDKEREQTRARWEAEVEAQHKVAADLADELTTSRKREAEAYEYETSKRRTLEEDKFQAEVAARRKSFALECQVRDEELLDREAKLTNSEFELADLRAQVTKFEETTKSEVSRAVAMATNSLKKDLTHDFALERLRLENELSQLKALVSARDNQIADLAKRNSELDSKYSQASDKVQAIAEKAIEGASKQGVVVQTSGHNDSSDSTSRTTKR